MARRHIRRASVSVGLIIALIFHVAPTLAVTESADIEFYVQEILTVAVVTPDNGATGEVDQFLRNKYTLSVYTNNENGFTASMTAKARTANLVNVAAYDNIIPTLTSSYARSNFPTNYWGYSIDDTDNGNSSSTYNKVASLIETPNTIMTANGSGNSSQDIYFGTKANASKSSGKYLATVVFNVVTGMITQENPITPENPTVPNGNSEPVYNSTNDITSYTAVTHSGSGSSSTTTTTTEISKGDNRANYVPPQGVVSTTNINESAPLATGLAVTATVAATAGVTFFVIAKNKEDDEDEDEEVA